MSLIPDLIDREDTFEIVRNKIALILITESANQVALATTEGKPNPQLWELKVYTERSNPWEQFLNNTAARTPIVNVWFDSSNFNPSASNVIERQATEAIYNIDIYGFGLSQADGAGHKAGDKDAALEMARAVRLVRSILMAAQYTYLDLARGTVWRRWVRSITAMQPQIDAQTVQQVVAARISFVVEFNEYAPQFTPETLETLALDIHRALDDALIAQAEYDYT